MPNKTEEYLALACKTADSFSRQWEHWAEFLITAARLYKYSYPDQLMIYAQRPDATACASIEIWNEKMHCWVNKGAKGIALIDEDSFSGLKYVFDISDVHKARKIGQFPNLWEMREEHMEAVISRLEKTYGDTDREAGFVGRIREVAGRIATEEEREYHEYFVQFLKKGDKDEIFPPFLELLNYTKAQVETLIRPMVDTLITARNKNLDFHITKAEILPVSFIRNQNIKGCDYD